MKIKVKCIKESPVDKGSLTVGKIYTVLDENSACFKVRNDHNKRRYHDRECFQIIEESKF